MIVLKFSSHNEVIFIQMSILGSHLVLTTLMRNITTLHRVTGMSAKLPFLRQVRVPNLMIHFPQAAIWQSKVKFFVQCTHNS